MMFDPLFVDAIGFVGMIGILLLISVLVNVIEAWFSLECRQALHLQKMWGMAAVGCICLIASSLVLIFR